MLQFAFECHPRQASAVFTTNQRTYQVCLKCGQSARAIFSFRCR